MPIDGGPLLSVSMLQVDPPYEEWFHPRSCDAQQPPRMYTGFYHFSRRRDVYKNANNFTLEWQSVRHFDTTSLLHL